MHVGWFFYTDKLSQNVLFINSVQFSCSVMSSSLRPHGMQHTRLPCPSPIPRACSNSYPLSRWYHPTILSSIMPFSSCLQSFLASGSFLMNQFFVSGGQSIRASASTSVLPVTIQDWFPLGSTAWISLLSKGLSSAFSNTTVQNHQLLSTQLSLWSNSHILTWLYTYINSFVLLIVFLICKFAFQISKYIFVRVYSPSPEL